MCVADKSMLMVARKFLLCFFKGIPCLFKGLLISSNAAVLWWEFRRQFTAWAQILCPIVASITWSVSWAFITHCNLSKLSVVADPSTLTHLPMSFPFVYLDYRHRGEEIHQFAHGFIIADDCIFYLHNTVATGLLLRASDSKNAAATSTT